MIVVLQKRQNKKVHVQLLNELFFDFYGLNSITFTMHEWFSGLKTAKTSLKSLKRPNKSLECIFLFCNFWRTTIFWEKVTFTLVSRLALTNKSIGQSLTSSLIKARLPKAIIYPQKFQITQNLKRKRCSTWGPCLARTLGQNKARHNGFRAHKQCHNWL